MVPTFKHRDCERDLYFKASCKNCSRWLRPTPIQWLEPLRLARIPVTMPHQGTFIPPNPHSGCHYFPVDVNSRTFCQEATRFYYRGRRDQALNLFGWAETRCRPIKARCLSGDTYPSAFANLHSVSLDIPRSQFARLLRL